MQNQWHWDLRAVTGPAVYKPSCLSLSSPHFSAFFFLLNPGCIFSLNQTICLLAFLSSNKDSRDPRAPWVQEPSLAVPRWPKEGVKCPRVGPGGRVSGRVLSFLPEVACAKQCLLGKGPVSASPLLPFAVDHGTVGSPARGKLPAGCGRSWSRGAGQ